MRTLRVLSVLSLSPILVALVACGSGAPPPAAPPVAPQSPPVTAAAPAPAAPTGPVDASPTVVTAEQKARDDARAPLAAALVDAFRNTDPLFSRDGKKILFLSTRDGVQEYYLADAANPSATPVAVTHGPERAPWAEFSRDGKSVFFTRDEGADENYRIFKVGLDGQNAVCLTPGPSLHRDNPFEPRGKPGTLLYTQHDNASAASELVSLAATGGAPKVLYKDPSPFFLTSVADDGKRALAVRVLSASDAIVFEVDLAHGTTRRLFPAEGKKAAVNDAQYSADGRKAIVAADDGANAQIIQAIDPATGAVKATYTQDDPPTAQIASLAVAPKGGLVAINLNAGNRSEVRILDANKLTLTTRVRSPFGQATLTRFSDDGSKLGLTLSQADVPGDVFSVDARTGLATPLRHDPRPGLESVPPQTTSITQTPGFDGLSIPINVYLPANAHGRLPVIVNFHGGPSSSSEVKWSPMIRFFSALGYAVVEPNVRGSAGFGRAYEMADNREKRADWLKDVETMNTWAKAQTWADPQRVTVMGGSYGGYTVLMALTRQPTLWRAGVDLAGVANLFTFLKSTDQGIRADFVQEFGDLDADKALLDEFSPMRDADKIAVPLFIYAGKNDPRVPLAEADQVVVALRKHGVPVEYMVSGNEGHSIDRRENRIEYLTRVARFLDDNAGGVAPAR